MDDSHLMMHLLAHVVAASADGGDHGGLFKVEEELEELVDDLVVELDRARHGPFELTEEHLEQFVGLDAHLALVLVSRLAVNVD